MIPMYNSDFFRGLINLDTESASRISIKIALQDDADIAMGLAEYIREVTIGNHSNEKHALNQWLTKDYSYTNADTKVWARAKKVSNGKESGKFQMSPLEAFATLLAPVDDNDKIVNTNIVKLSKEKKELFDLLSASLYVLQNECGENVGFPKLQSFDVFTAMCLAWVRDPEVHDNLLTKNPALKKISIQTPIFAHQASINNRDDPLGLNRIGFSGPTGCVVDLNPIGMRSLDRFTSINMMILGKSPFAVMSKGLATGKIDGITFSTDTLLKTMLKEWENNRTKSHDSLFYAVADSFAYAGTFDSEKIAGQKNLLVTLAEKLSREYDGRHEGFLDHINEQIFENPKFGIYRPGVLDYLEPAEKANALEAVLSLCDYKHLHHFDNAIDPNRPMDYHNPVNLAYIGTCHVKSNSTQEDFSRTVDYLVNKLGVPINGGDKEKGMTLLHKMADCMHRSQLLSPEKILGCMKKLVEMGCDPEARCTKRRWKPESHMPPQYRDSWKALIQSLKARNAAFDVLDELGLRSTQP